MSPHDTAKHVVDVVSVSTTVGALLGWLPAVAALLTIIWTAIRIWETPTLQKIFAKKRARRAVK